MTPLLESLRGPGYRSVHRPTMLTTGKKSYCDFASSFAPGIFLYVAWSIGGSPIPALEVEHNLESLPEQDLGYSICHELVAGFELLL